MTKEECMDLYHRVRDNWNLTPADYKSTLKTWWYYLGDLNPQQVSNEIDKQAYTGDYPPRPAELRTRILHPNLPTPQEAYRQATQLTDAIRLGTPIPQVHETVTATIEAIGTTNEYDFKQEHKKQTQQWVLTANEPHTTNTSQTTDTNDA